MKELILKPKISVIKKNLDLYEKDIEQVPRSCIPGEWILVKDKFNKKDYIGYINNFVSSGPIIRLVGIYKGDPENEESTTASKIILGNLAKALKKREIFKEYRSCMRLVHGGADHLPGLIIDEYKNYILIQINTAGIDRFRKEIKQFLGKDKKIFFLDSPKYRENEGLPEFEEEKIPDDLLIEENGFNYSLGPHLIQKIGYYYDHRENRKKLEVKIKELNISLNKGLDLFCYVGSWGLHLLRGGVSNVTFVDQGNFAKEIDHHLALNSFKGQGNFIQSDVFSFLDTAIQKNEIYDVVVGDPPAFSKEAKNIKSALAGYQKLHRKVMQILAPQALYAAASCTHNISFSDLAKTVYEASIKEGKSLEIIDVGVQGGDHPFSSFESKEHYLKYILYIVRTDEKGVIDEH